MHAVKQDFQDHKNPVLIHKKGHRRGEAGILRSCLNQDDGVRFLSSLKVLTLIVIGLLVGGCGGKAAPDHHAKTKAPSTPASEEAKKTGPKTDSVPAKNEPPVKGKTFLDDVKKVGFPKSAFEYAKMCEPELGVPPKVNLDKSVEIPIYVNGVQAYGEFFSCDNPALIGKSTVSGSTLQRYEGRTAEGKPLPDVIWVAFGRNTSSSHKHVAGSLQMIGYNKKTGATAFFESSDRIGPWVTLDKDTLRMRGEMPGIDNPEGFNRAFVTPPIQCVQCHQSDPFITNSFINAAKIPGTDKPVIPVLDEDSPYYVIGGENWDMRTVHIQNHACFDCHRVGMKTIELFMNSGWDPNKHMPPRKPGSLAGELRELLDAWKNGPENVEGAEWIIPPARGKDRQVVGDDYPYKAAFNRPKAAVSRPGTNDEKAGPKATTLKDRNEEVEKLLKQLLDPQTRKGFEAWIKENGVTEETLEKLRSTAEGDDTDDGKLDDNDTKDNYEKAEDKGESQDMKD
jgi:hypothetical protein